MNIVKEYIKVEIVNPTWRKTLKQIKKDKNKKIILIGTPAHGNLGDHAIAEEEKNFIKKYYQEYNIYEIIMPLYNICKNKLKKITSPEDIIIISGGGWMGNLWLHNEITIRNIIKNYNNNKIIIFPQTIFYTDDEKGRKECKITSEYISNHKNLIICLREKRSYNFAKNNYKFQGNSKPVLCPDIVLFGSCEYAKKYPAKANKINICLRKDCEKVTDTREEMIEKILEYGEIKEITTVVPRLIPLKNRTKELEKIWKEFSEGSITITDRLHGMLFSVLNQTPCIVLNNKTGKVFGVLEWIKSSNMVLTAETEEDILQKVPQALMMKDCKYNKDILKKEFEKMAKEIKEETKKNED